jgi:hypothetical protein
MNLNCLISGLAVTTLLISPAFAAGVNCDAGGRAPDLRCSPIMTVLADALTDTSDHASSANGDTLWRMWVDQERIWIQDAPAASLAFSHPRPVNAEPEPISTGAENRPRLLVAGDEVTVVWSRPGQQRFTADVRMARSIDRGRSFGLARMVNRDGMKIGHSFADVIPDADGRPRLLWLDGRDRHAAEANGVEFVGSSLYWSGLHDDGELAADRAAAVGSCECCRLATARLPDGRPLVMWRHVFAGGERDHALGLFDGDQFKWRRASFEHWRIDGCPHHGPALAVDDSAGIHAAWFSGAESARGLFYRRFDADWLAAGDRRGEYRASAVAPGPGSKPRYAGPGLARIRWRAAPDPGPDFERSRHHLESASHPGAP